MGGRAWRLEPARRILLSAWSDLGVGSYEWAIAKAWRASVAVLAGPYGGLGPSEVIASSGFMTAGLSHVCRDLERLIPCASTLDARASPLLYPEVESLLGVELGYSRVDVLESIECTLKIIDSLEACGAGGRIEPALPLGILRRHLDGLAGALGEATIVAAGGVYLIVTDEARGRSYAERVRALPAPPPPAMSLILSPEEAAILLGLPSWAGASMDFVRDDYGLEAVKGRRLL